MTYENPKILSPFVKSTKTSHLKGMVGQTAARRAAGVVVEMVKEGKSIIKSNVVLNTFVMIIPDTSCPSK